MTATTRAGADTVAELVRRRWGDHRTGLRGEHHTLSHHRAAAGAAARAAPPVELMPPRPGGEPHLGLLLDNTPEYPLRLGAAALAGAAVAGVDPTRRGAGPARDITHTACRILVTQRTHLPCPRHPARPSAAPRRPAAARRPPRPRAGLTGTGRGWGRPHLRHTLPPHGPGAPPPPTVGGHGRS